MSSGFGRAICLSTTVRAGFIGRAAAAAPAAAKDKQSRKAAAIARGASGQINSDSRYEIMKQIMYQQEPRQLPELTAEDAERHETILRAVKLHRLQESNRRRDEREAKFSAMEKAYAALEKLDPRLFEEACKKDANVTFPRQMRVPTETPPTVIWDYMEETVTKK
ncbi:hypothetical protein IWW48_000632 [Coemansia sp. RSA 1200]|nr:hypothetical protein IWW48_000632 [Coemansia sp. RSA 1200]